MTNQPSCPTSAAHPSLQDLTNRFLARRASGTDVDSVDAEGAVFPHEVAGGFQTPVKLTWDEAVAAFKLFGVTPDKVACPPEWAAFIGLDSAAVAVPLAAGVFPQRFQLMPATLADQDLTCLRPTPTAPVGGFAELRAWVRKALASCSPTSLLLAAGVAAVLGDRDNAAAALAAAERVCVGDWRAAWENQRAAVLWLTGAAADAEAAWSALPDCPATAFNRGLAALFAGRPEAAVAPLRSAAASLPDASGWCHLARLYLSLAESRVG